MRAFILLFLLSLPLQIPAQSLAIGIPEPMSDPEPEKKGYEFHPEGYRDTVRISLEKVQYLDTARFHISFSSSAFERITHFEQGEEPRPIVWVLNGKPVLGAWLLSPLSSSGVEWVTCILLPSKNGLVIQLGHPPSHYKYWEKEDPDPRKEAGLIEFFKEHEKIRERR